MDDAAWRSLGRLEMVENVWGWLRTAGDGWEWLRMVADALKWLWVDDDEKSRGCDLSFHEITCKMVGVFNLLVVVKAEDGSRWL